MSKWRLIDRSGHTIKVIEAKDKIDGDLFGLKNYPGRYSRAEDVEAEEARHKERIAKLQESFKRGFIQQGLSPKQAEVLAEIAAKGRPSW